MKNKKALAGVLLSLSLAGGIVAPASVAFATDETPAVAPVAEAPAPAAEPVVAEAPAPVTAEIPATAPTTEASTSEARSFYVHIYQNEELLLEGIRPLQVKLGDDPIAFVRSQTFNEEYGLFLRGEVEYLNEGAGIVKLYFSTAVTTTTEATTTTASPEPTTTTVTTEPTTTEVPTTEAPTTEAPTTEAPSTVQISFHLDGGTLQGQTGTVTLEARVGDVITLPEAPTREGYKFLYWKGSVYQPGANYTVTGPKTFTAVWEPVAKQATTTTSASGTPQKILPATGDPGSLLSLVGLGVAGFAGLLGLKRPRKN